jgi:hypothetical protein
MRVSVDGAVKVELMPQERKVQAAFRQTLKCSPTLNSGTGWEIRAEIPSAHPDTRLKEGSPMTTWVDRSEKGLWEITNHLWDQ